MTIHEEIDQSAASRIVGIASGTVNPVSTIIAALRDASRADPYTKNSPWGDLIDAIWRIDNAWGMDAETQAMNAHDAACEALKKLLDE